MLNNNFIKPLICSSGRKIIISGRTLVFAVIFTALLISSCGLPSYPFLYAPEVEYIRDDPDTIDDKDLVFRNAYKNNPNLFSGYEIYYKIYDPLSDSDTADDYVTDRTAINSNDNASYSTLKGRDFNRLFFTSDFDADYYTNNDTLPALRLDQTLLEENFLIRFLFLQPETADGSSFYASAWDTDTYSIGSLYFYRWVFNDHKNDYIRKYFDISDFDIYDSDMPDTITADSLNEPDYYVFITFYIMSFGREADNYTNSVYSLPEYLGTLKFKCNLTDGDF